MFDCAIIGGGVVGLATAMTLGRRQPDIKLVVLEKESDSAPPDWTLNLLNHGR
jgi:L-2-hydroxyglutarate oxidase